MILGNPFGIPYLKTHSHDLIEHDHSDDDSGGDIKQFGIKVHRAEDLVAPNTTAWHDVTFDLKVEDESLPGIGFYNEGLPGEDKSILVIDTDRILLVYGCIHPEWTGGNAIVEYATRIVFSNNAGSTWNEARCLQMYAKKSRTADDAGSRAYVGSIKAENPTWIKLQYRVSNVSLIFSGWSGFDNGVAMTLSLRG